MSRFCTEFVTSSMRSANVDLPWSMWATIEKLRIFSGFTAFEAGESLGALFLFRDHGFEPHGKLA